MEHENTHGLYNLGNELTTLITAPYTPTKGTQISTESFGFQTEWKVGFEVNLDGTIPSSHENIFRVTKGGLGYSNKDQCGDRYPAVWLLAENSLSNRIYTESCVNGNGIGHTESISLNKWVPIEIGQEKRTDGNIWFYIIVENVTVYEIKNDSPSTFDNLHLWASDSTFDSADGVRIRNWGYSTGGKLGPSY